MNAFEDQAFREAVKATGRKRLIIGGLHTEICLSFATVQALKDGYDVMYVTDAVGGRSQVAHRTGIERLAHAGAVPTTALAVNTELFRDWATPLAGPAARRHLLVLHRGPEAHRRRRCRGRGEAGRGGRPRGSKVMPGRLSGKVCVVTGTGGSMGRATALTFAREGRSGRRLRRGGRARGRDRRAGTGGGRRDGVAAAVSSRAIRPSARSSSSWR